MIVTKRALSRRTVLRGIGATLALPFLDGMVPAFAAQRTAIAPIRRLGVVYLSNGVVMQNWTPAAEGAAFEFTRILKPLEPFRDHLTLVTGLNRTRGGGVHAGASTGFLTGVPQTRTPAIGEAGVSIDQIVAKEFGRHTELASLQLALESPDSGTTCDPAASCAHTNTISWAGPTTPLPMEHNPRAVFERMFGDSGSTDPTVRLARIRQQRSILDSVTEKIAGLQRGLGQGDRVKLGEYLDAVRDLERRIQKAEEQSTRDLPTVEQPLGIPAKYEDHAKLMFDLQVLAYQTDITRVITFMFEREFSGRMYPEIGVPDAHHPISHHGGDPEKLEKLTKINTFHSSLLAYYIDRLRSTPDGDGSLLDHVMLIFGAGMSDGNGHNPRNLPMVLVGGGAGQLKGGRHLRYAGDPHTNLLLTVLEKIGVPLEKIGDSTGKLELSAEPLSL